MKIRPLFRPFVIRPTLWMAATSLILMLAYFSVWDSVFLVLGNGAWAGPALLILLPILLLVARAIAYRGTHYTIAKDRILVNHGGVFGDRRVELDLVNITLVEWRSPYLLKLLHGVGHIVIQEAGSAHQNARLVYIEDPQRIYRRIAQNMRTQGFSMQRNARIARQKSGILGALVDMTGFGIATAYSIVVVADSVALAFGRIATNVAASLRPLTQEAVAQVERVEFIVRIVVFGLSGIIVLGLTIWMVFKFIELSRRTLTLHDDVVDYYQGFLSEKRQFIPLENLTDTQLLRPLYKRILGLSDLQLSSRGAGSNLSFNSMPGAEEFAAALELQLDEMKASRQALAEVAAAEDAQGAAGSRSSRTYTIKPEVWRAATGSLLKLMTLPLIVFASMGFFAALSAMGVDNLGTIGAGMLGTIAIWGSIWLASTLFSMGRGVLHARATEYSFDGQRASKTFDFLNRQETKFAVDQITSFSILTNPIDRLLGTMTLRLRSVGSAQPLDFQYIADDPNLIAGLEDALGFKPAAPSSDAPSKQAMNPKFTLLEGMKAHLGSFLGAGASVLSAALFIGLVEGSWALAASISVGALLLGLPTYMLWQSLRVGRLRATFDAHTVTVAGGVFRHFSHHTAACHIKGVSTVQYPASSRGALSIATGGGFTMKIDFLPAIRVLHDRLDSLLLDRRVASLEAGSASEFRPNAATEAMRHFGRFALLILPILTMPISLPWVALRSKRTRYRVEGDRIFIELPLVYHYRRSVVFERIDHLESSRNMANKLFGTRDVEVYTVGSSAVDIRLRALKEGEQILALIRERMAEATTSQEQIESQPA
ncbi:PH domain-containing protein [Bradymonas sediminis]|uniref:YdbS-like PH domain-containing protein n=1 Tax=Bradymonas sediminis TaxID=1548548 RepID=A0A2Z4FQR4_9DELT|nr:PH domain-containing protein [Bradymonas sediminis]AWV91290.1 hypothetical protein DN745_18960 [Bradymonas sediminis]